MRQKQTINYYLPNYNYTVFEENCNLQFGLYKHASSTLDTSSMDKSDPLWYDRQQKKPTRREVGMMANNSTLKMKMLAL